MGNCREEENIIQNYYKQPLSSMVKIDPDTFETVKKIKNLIQVEDKLPPPPCYNPNTPYDWLADIYNQENEYDRQRNSYQTASAIEANHMIERLRDKKVNPLKTFFILKGFLSTEQLHDSRTSRYKDEYHPYEFLSTDELFKCNVINKVIISILEGALGLKEVSLSEETKRNWNANLVETVLLTYNSEDFLDSSKSPDHHAKPSDSIFFKNDDQEKNEMLKRSNLSEATFNQHIKTLQDLEKDIYNTFVEAEKVNFDALPEFLHWDSFDNALKKRIETNVFKWKEQQKEVVNIIENMLKRGFNIIKYRYAFRNIHLAYRHSDKKFSLHDEISIKQIQEIWKSICNFIQNIWPNNDNIPIEEIRCALFLMQDKHIDLTEKKDLIRPLFLSFFEKDVNNLNNFLDLVIPFVDSSMLNALETIEIPQINPLINLIDFLNNDDENIKKISEHILKNNALIESNPPLIYELLNKCFQQIIFDLFNNQESSGKIIWWKQLLQILKEKIWNVDRKSYLENQINNSNSYFFRAISEPDLLQYIIETLELTNEELKNIYENHLDSVLNSCILNSCTRYLNNPLEDIQEILNKNVESLKILQDKNVNLAQLNSEGNTIVGSLFTQILGYTNEQKGNFLKIILKLKKASDFFQDSKSVIEYLNQKIKDKEEKKEEPKKIETCRPYFSNSSSDEEDSNNTDEDYSKLLELYTNACKQAKFGLF